MSVPQHPWVRMLAVATLMAVPFLGAEVYFRVNAPGQGAGVYLETDHNYKATLLESDRELNTLSGFAPDGPGAAQAAMARSPITEPGRRVSFYIVAPPASALHAHVSEAKLWSFVVDGANDGFRAGAAPVPATITQINPGVFRVSSPELEQVWGGDRIAFAQFERALSTSHAPRVRMVAMIGLELPEGPDRARRMYSVRVGPPQ